MEGVGVWSRLGFAIRDSLWPYSGLGYSLGLPSSLADAVPPWEPDRHSPVHSGHVVKHKTRGEETQRPVRSGCSGARAMPDTRQAPCPARRKCGTPCHGGGNRDGPIGREGGVSGREMQKFCCSRGDAAGRAGGTCPTPARLLGMLVRDRLSGRRCGHASSCGMLFLDRWLYDG